MKAVNLALSDGLGLPFPGLRLTSVRLEETMNKTTLCELTGWMPLILGEDPRLWRGGTVTLACGVAPMRTQRTLVLESPVIEYARGGISFTQKAKCLGGRMQRTKEDKIWRMQTPVTIATQIAASYLMRCSMETVHPASFIPFTIHQRVTDWEFMAQLAARIDADLLVQDRVVRFVQRDTLVNAPTARQYVNGISPVTFKREGDHKGRTGAIAQGGRTVSIAPTEADVNAVAGEIGTPPTDGAIQGQEATFVPNMEGVSGGTAPSGLPGLIPYYLGKLLGQFDPGAPDPAIDANAAQKLARDKSIRRNARDAVNKGTLSYREYSPTGTPVVGSKVSLVGYGMAASGEYIVIGRRITMGPAVDVELTISRHALGTGKKNTVDPQASPALVNEVATEIGGESTVTPSASGGTMQTTQDFATGG